LDEALESAKRLAPFIAQKKKKKQGVWILHKIPAAMFPKVIWLWWWPNDVQVAQYQLLY
jgi:hypothetical protein